MEGEDETVVVAVGSVEEAVDSVEEEDALVVEAVALVVLETKVLLAKSWRLQLSFMLAREML